MATKRRLASDNQAETRAQIPFTESYDRKNKCPKNVVLYTVMTKNVYLLSGIVNSQEPCQ